MFKILGSLLMMFGGAIVVALVNEFYISGPLPPWLAVFTFFAAVYIAGSFIFAGALLMNINTYRVTKENLLRIFGTKV